MKTNTSRKSTRFLKAVATITMLLCAVTASAERVINPENLFVEAHKSYNKGDYYEATQLFQRMIDNDIRSADIYYNLGNSYFRQNDFAKAILNYERGLRIRPNDADIRYNLQLANTFIKDEIATVRPFFLLEWWNRWVSLLPPGLWLVAHILFFLLTLWMVMKFLTAGTVSTRVAGFRTALLALTLSILLLIPALQIHRSKQKLNEAIITAEKSVIKSGPDARNNTLGQYHNGTKVRITNRDAGWCEVRTPDGHVGWVIKEDLEFI